MKKLLLTILLMLTVVMLTACAGETAPSEEMSELENRIASLETQLSEKETSIQVLQTQVEEKETIITDLETQVDELEELLKEAPTPAPTDVSELESRIASLETQLSEKETTIQMLQSQLGEKETIITDLETQVDELEELLEEAAAQVPTPSTFEPIVITGSGDKTSPPFTVTTEEWVIDWSYVPDPEYPEFAVFCFYVYPRGETLWDVASVLFPEGTSGSTYCYAGAGEYYIEVTAANVKSWEVIISPP